MKAEFSDFLVFNDSIALSNIDFDHFSTAGRIDGGD